MARWPWSRPTLCSGKTRRVGHPLGTLDLRDIKDHESSGRCSTHDAVSQRLHVAARHSAAYALAVLEPRLDAHHHAIDVAAPWVSTDGALAAPLAYRGRLPVPPDLRFSWWSLGDSNP